MHGSTFRRISRSQCLAAGLGLFVAVARPALSQPLTVTHLAGPAVGAGYSDGVGSAARFGSDLGGAADAAGNVYLADKTSHTIRKVSPSGFTTTLAGRAGSSGSTDGPGSLARFKDPTGVAVDASGNVYVSDRGNYTIRKVTSAGVVTTLAGQAGEIGSNSGTGSTARFQVLAAITVDGSGNVFVAEQGLVTNPMVRKVTPAGDVTSVADISGGSQSFGGIAVDDSGISFVSVWDRGVILNVTGDR